MGRDIDAIKITGEDRRRYRDKVRRSLDVFARMLREHRFEGDPPQVGVEVELNLVDGDGEPSMQNADVLDAIADPAWATELGQFNLEINVPPRELGGTAVADLEQELRGSLNNADEKAAKVGSRLVMVGILPTLREDHMHEGTISANTRYRVLPAGPSVADVVANAAFYYGLLRALAEAQRPIWTQLSFATAEENLHEAARHGMDARLYWPGLGEAPAAELVLRRLLPMARDGLAAWGVSTSLADRLLDIIEQRCLTGQTGAAWQKATVAALSNHGAADRSEALRLMTQRYIDHMHTNEPVHTWPITL